MKKKIQGPTWKKGQAVLPPVYHPPVELEANLTEEQKKWPRTGLVGSQTEAECVPPQVESRDPTPPAGG